MQKLYLVYRRKHHTTESIYHTGEKTFTSERVQFACTSNEQAVALAEEKKAAEKWHGYGVYEVDYIPGRKPTDTVYVIEGNYRPLAVCDSEADALAQIPILKRRYGGFIPQYFTKQVPLLAAAKVGVA